MGPPRWLLVAAAVLLVSSVASQKVHVELFAEAQCPYCAEFTLKVLQPLFERESGISNLMWLDYIPWGNAKYDVEKGEAVCQHGELECKYNRMLGCAMAAYPMQHDWFPFVTCMEKAATGDDAEKLYEATKACAVHAGLVSSRVIACYEGPLGTDMQAKAKERTDSLKPSHEYVPWVVVNGVPLFDDYENVKTYVCAAYTERDRPKACLEPPTPPSENSKGRVCLKPSLHEQTTPMS